MVQAGDSLYTIAASQWGDSSLWYLIAEANGLSAATNLTPGQTLSIPNKVTNVHNTSATGGVYDPGTTMGDTSPTIPDAPPPPKAHHKGCGALGFILTFVVAVVVTVATSGAVGAAMGVVGSGAGGFAATMTAGATVLSGGAGFGAALGAAAIGGAVGSIASQGVAIATGMQDGFSWKGVAMGAIGAGAAAGVGAAANIGMSAQQIAAAQQSVSWSTVALRAAESSVITQGVGSMLGVSSFSWKAVAAAAAGAGASTALGTAGWMKGLNSSNSVASVAAGTVRGLVSGGIQAGIFGSSPNWGSIAAQSFGNALGDSVTQSKVNAEAQRVGDAVDGGDKQPTDYRNGSDIDDDIAGVRAAHAKLVAAGASEETANRYAAAYRELEADPTKFLDFGRGSASALSQKFAVRPDDPQQASAYDKVLRMEGKTSADAWLTSKDVAFRQQLDDMGRSIEVLSATDPSQASALAQQHRVGVMALLNREVYFDGGMPELLPSGWGRVSNAAGLARANLTPEILVNQENGYFAALYHNQTDGSYVYANRGTDQLKDWTHNFLQAVGETSSQYEQALSNARRIARSAIAESVTFTGHSLGGGLASAQSFATGIAGVTFNAAGLNSNTVGATGAVRMSSNLGLVKAYYVNGELLSTLQDSGSTVAGATLTALGSPLAGLAAYATLSKVPQAAGSRIVMDAVMDPSYRRGVWQQGSSFTALTPSMVLDLHGMSYVINSVMQRVLPTRP